MHARPLLNIDSEELDRVLRKKHTRNRRNRLKRPGELSHDKIESVEQFESLFDDVIHFYDFRQGAANGSFPFQQDARKKSLSFGVIAMSARATAHYRRQFKRPADRCPNQHHWSPSDPHGHQRLFPVLRCAIAGGHCTFCTSAKCC